MKSFNLIEMVVLVTMLAVLAGCERTSRLGWTGKVSGQGKKITSVGMDVNVLPPPPPAPIEQLEKGNSATVIKQIQAAKARDEQAQADTPICVGDECYIPYKNATGVRSSPSETGASWYNGFLD